MGVLRSKRAPPPALPPAAESTEFSTGFALRLARGWNLKTSILGTYHIHTHTPPFLLNESRKCPDEGYTKEALWPPQVGPDQSLAIATATIAHNMLLLRPLKAYEPSAVVARRLRRVTYSS